MAGGLTIDGVTKAEAPAIRDLLTAAFGGPAEADLVDALRAGGFVALELAARDETGPAGYLAFSRLAVAAPNERRRALCLAPLAVRPDRQRRGIGTALVREGLARLEASDEDIVLVLGDPAYYGRFGFRPGRPDRMETPYPHPENQWLVLKDRPLPLRLALQYPPPFAALG
ncbi:GNAT family N-acetyltransferase [Prosthecomicrobium sp. N25]|uniref:GNAT family N-acetyltransferase n=1 Tax=Prosthecomicrobium sp. N25 TaxID=3129254 RepID=UPI003076C8E6